LKLPVKNNFVSAEDSATHHDSDGRPHLTARRISGSRPPLFCILPGEPGARDMMEALPDDQPVFEFLFASLGDSDFPPIEQLAVRYLKDLREFRPHGPYQLCGYSNGGFVAYEMARTLINQGENVSFLCLFDTWHPEFIQNLSLTEVAKYRAIRFVDRLRKYGRFLRQGRLDEVVSRAAEFVVKHSKLIGWQAIRLVFQKANRPPPKSMQTFESIRSYSPKPYPKRFVLIRVEDPIDDKLKDLTVGWHACAAEGIDVHFIRAEHGKMLYEPCVRDVVEKMAPYLASAAAPVTTPVATEDDDDIFR